ncbi:MAG TPA: hypothetical protein V6D47_20755 [Oscillatoriaceae cyanobacterium]
MSGHVTFLGRHAAALFELMLRIRHENANFASSALDFFSSPRKFAVNLEESNQLPT